MGTEMVEKPPPAFVVHAVLCFGQICMGGASVIGKLGLNDCDPATFALYRQLLGAPLLLALARIYESSNLLPAPGTWSLWAACGVFLFLNQFCFLVGLAWAPGTSAAAWQPSQPIFTACIAISGGWEQVSMRKLGGILLGFVGGLLLIVLSSAGNSQTTLERAGPGGVPASAIGNTLFFLNCLATSLYVITSKRALASPAAGELRRPVALTAGSYVVALFVMLATHVLVLENSNVRAMVIAPGSNAPRPSWTVPVSAWPALAYCVIFQSVLGYIAITWSVRFVDASTVSLYVVLQPIVACVGNTFCIIIGYNPNGVFQLPGENLLGAPLVIAGLLCVVWGSNAKPTRPEGLQESLRPDPES